MAPPATSSNNRLCVHVVAHMYFFLQAAARISLFPFLSLFLRLSGLTSVQAGVALSLHALAGALGSPLWASCARRCTLVRPVLCGSIALAALGYGLLAWLPPLDSSYAALFCTEDTQTAINTYLADSNHSLNANNRVLPASGSSQAMTPVQGGKSSTMTSVPLFVSSTVPSSHTLSVSIGLSALTSASSPSAVLHHTTDAHILPSLSSTKFSQTDTLSKYKLEKLISIFMDFYELESEDVEKYTPRQLQHFLSVFVHEHPGAARLALLSRQRRWWHPKLASRKPITYRQAEEVLRKRSKLWHERTFLLAVALLCVTELLSAGARQAADTAWKDYLEEQELSALYGRHQTWVWLGQGLYALLVTLLYQRSACSLWWGLDRFSIHFLAFVLLQLLSAPFAALFPTARRRKDPAYRGSNVLRGVRLLCCSPHPWLVATSFLLLGMLATSTNYFLFWLLQDLGASPIVMGAALAVYSVSMLPLVLFSSALTARLGHWTVCALAVLLAGIRLLYLSFLWTPWAALPAELLAAAAAALLSSVLKNNSPLTLSAAGADGAQALCHWLYTHAAPVPAAALSGWLYSLAPSLLYQAGCAVALCWLVIFLLVRRCTEPPLQQAKYSRLLDASDSDPDWLSAALNE